MDDIDRAREQMRAANQQLPEIIAELRERGLLRPMRRRARMPFWRRTLGDIGYWDTEETIEAGE